MSNKTNFVTLDLDIYEELTKFKRNILEGKIAVTTYTNYQQINYHTNDEIIKDLTKKYNLLDEQNFNLNKEYNKVRSDYQELKIKFDSIFTETSQVKELTVESLKKMNIFQLIKWKFNNK